MGGRAGAAAVPGLPAPLRRSGEKGGKPQPSHETLVPWAVLCQRGGWQTVKLEENFIYEHRELRSGWPLEPPVYFFFMNLGLLQIFPYLGDLLVAGIPGTI